MHSTLLTLASLDLFAVQERPACGGAGPDLVILCRLCCGCHCMKLSKPSGTSRGSLRISEVNSQALLLGHVAAMACSARDHIPWNSVNPTKIPSIYKSEHHFGFIFLQWSIGHKFVTVMLPDTTYH